MKLQIPKSVEAGIAAVIAKPDEELIDLYGIATILHDLDAFKIAGMVYMIAHAPEMTDHKHLLGVAQTIRLLIYALHRAGFSQYEIGLLTLTIGARKIGAIMAQHLVHVVHDAMEHEHDKEHAVQAAHKEETN